MAAMLQDTPSTAPDALRAETADTGEAVQGLHDQIKRMQAELQFEKTRNEALNFEIARLKRWRFGSSAESLDSTTQAVLFDAILADTALEDSAAKEADKEAAAVPPRTKGQAVRQALPANLPRVDRHHELGATHCACGEAFKRIGRCQENGSASNSTACPPSSSCCATFAANTPAPAARPFRPPPCPRR